MRKTMAEQWGRVNGTNAFDQKITKEEEEDWETTGEEEMSRLQAECKQKRSVLHVRDRLTNLKDLVTVSHEALFHSSLTDINTQVGNVLYFHILEQIKIAEEELSHV